MRFAHSNLLWLLAILPPLLIAFLFWAWRAKQKQIAQFVQSRLLANLTVGVSQGRQKLRLVLLATSVAFLLLAVAGPQFGTDWQEARQQGLDVIVAIDTSRSMLATDIAPNRLTRAKLAALDLMRLAKSDRLGLIAFAGSAFLQCPLTLDEEAFRQNVEAMNVGIIPQGGTAIGEAIEVAMKAVAKKNDNHRVLVIFTDGEDHDSGAVPAAQKAAKEGLMIFTIGVGTADGELIRVPDENGKPGFLKDESGNAVKSRLNEPLLQQIATEAHGFYLPLRGTKSMETLYARGLAPLPKSDSTAKLIRVYREQFLWPLAVAMFCLLLELFLPQRRRVRPTTNTGSQAPPPVTTKLAVLLAAAMFLPSVGQSSPATARQLYDEGRFKDALLEYQRLLDKQEKAGGDSSSPRLDESVDGRPPDGREKAAGRALHGDPRLQFNAGDAAYRAGRFQQAEDHFNKALLTDDAQLLQQAFYNLGNTHYQSGQAEGDPQKKMELWEKALKDYEGALSLQNNDASARHNRELVQRRLEELKKQQKDDPNSKDKKDKKPSDQDKKQDQSKDQQDKEKQEQAKNSPEDNKKSPDSKQKPDSGKDQKEKKQDQDKPGQDKPGESEKPGQTPGEKPDDKRPKQPGGEATATGVANQMTPQQAKQMLDAQKGDDRPLIFLPAEAAKNRNRLLKDW